MKKILALTLALILALAGCASIDKIEGTQEVNGRMTMTLPEAWNRVTLPGNNDPFQTWTQEGLALDQLRFWAAIKSGQSIGAPAPSNTSGGQAPRVPTFTAGMSPDQLVQLFEILYANDGSLVTMQRVDATTLAGEKGVRFEF